MQFYRVRQLKFHGEREEELDDILLMVSAFGLFSYAVFSTVAGSLSAYTKEPNLLVMVTGILSVLQVLEHNCLCDKLGGVLGWDDECN